jgi:hypothetical protein
MTSPPPLPAPLLAPPGDPIDEAVYSDLAGVVMVFSVTDVTAPQGLLYKGTGSNVTSPQLSMSYRVAVMNGAVTLQFTDGTSAITELFTGPSIDPNKFYELIIVKGTVTGARTADSTGPYAHPLSVTDLESATQSGTTLNAPGTGPGTITINDIAPVGSFATKMTAFLNQIPSGSSQVYQITFPIRAVHIDGSFGDWASPASQQVTSSSGGSTGLLVNSTGDAHLLIGSAYSDKWKAMPLGSTTYTGNIRSVYFFNGAINSRCISTSNGVVDIAAVSSQDLIQAGIMGFWIAQYDINGVVNNPLDQTAAAIFSNTSAAILAPLKGHEFGGTTLHIVGAYGQCQASGE